MRRRTRRDRARRLDRVRGLRIALGQRIGGDWALGHGLVLRVWTAEVVEGTPQPLEDHDELRWLAPGEWYGVAWLAADLPVIAALRERLGR